jgi:uncharacterized delta-60 repeat protein
MKKVSRFVLAVLLVFGLALGVKSVEAAAGSLDTTFGTGGVVVTTLTTPSDSNSAIPYAVAQQTTPGLATTGDILVLVIVTTTGAGASTTTEVLAYTSAGVLDKNFGNKGIAALPIVLGPPAMAVQPDGRIVVVGAGTSSNVLAAERLNTNGTADTAFGTDGLATTSLNCCGTEMTVAVEPSSGDIVACTQLEPTGRKEAFHTALAQFLSDGTVDTSFGSDGIVNVVGVGGCAAVALLSDGDILVENGPSAQFNFAGIQESTVTGGTIVATGGSENPLSIGSIFQPNGDYLAAEEVFTGEESRGHNAAAQVLRFTVTGVQDSTFVSPPFHFAGTGGSGIEAQPNAIALQSNGDIVVVGLQTTSSQSGTTLVNGLARLTSSGALDTTFGTSGTVTNAAPSGTEGLDGVLIDSQGRIVTVGVANSFTAVTVSRYLAH